MGKNKYKIIEPFLKKEKKLKELSSEHDVPYSTLKRWIKSYKESGKKGLEKKTRSDKNSFRKADEDTMSYILEEHNKNPNLNITNLYNNYLKAFKTKNKLSYNTIYRIATNLDPFSQKYVKKNLKNIEQPHEIYRISTEKIYIKNLDENNEVGTVILIYDVYDDSILNYKIYTKNLEEEDYLSFIRDTFIVNREKDFVIIPEYIYIDKFKMKNKDKFFEILRELKLNINGVLEKNIEITRFVRFLESDIKNIFKDEKLSVRFLNYNLRKYICSGTSTKPLEANKLYDLNKLDYLLEVANRKIYNNGIRFKNNIYFNNHLKKHTGKVVTLRYNPFDLTVLKVYLKNNFLFSIYPKDSLM